MTTVTPARDEILWATRELVHLSSSCMGPFGRSKFLQVGADRTRVAVTSSGQRIFGAASSSLPAMNSAPARVLVNAVTSHAKQHGDGSLFTANFAGRLLIEALDPDDGEQLKGGLGGGMSALGKRRGLHVTREGFALALEWSLEYLNSPACPVRVPGPRRRGVQFEGGFSSRGGDDEEQGENEEKETRIVMVALASAMLHSKLAYRLRGQDRRRLAELSVRAYRGSRAKRGEDGSSMVANTNVRILPILGPPCRDSEVIKNAILVETHLPLSHPGLQPLLSRRPLPSKTQSHVSNTPGPCEGSSHASNVSPVAPPSTLSGNAATSVRPSDYSSPSRLPKSSLIPSSGSPEKLVDPGAGAGTGSSSLRTYPTAPATLSPTSSSQGGVSLSGAVTTSRPTSSADNFATSHALRTEEDPNERNEDGGVFPTGGGDRSRDGGSHRASFAEAKVKSSVMREGPITVALFESSLQMELGDPFDLAGPDGGSSGLQAEFSYEYKESDECGPAWTVKEREFEELEAFAKSIVEAGVGLVACQRLIHPHLRRRLSEAGVLSLERLSALNIAAFRSVTGARQIGSWLLRGSPQRQLQPDDLGAAELVTVRRFNGKAFLEVASVGEAALEALGTSVDVTALRKRRRPSMTLALCAPDEPALDEIKTAVEGLMRVLAQTDMEGGVALTGAGCWEVHLASHLRKRARHLLRPPPLPRHQPPTPPQHPKQQQSQQNPPANNGTGKRIGRAGRRRFDSPPRTSSLAPTPTTTFPGRSVGRCHAEPGTDIERQGKEMAGKSGNPSAGFPSDERRDVRAWMDTRGILQEGRDPDPGLALASAVDAFAKCLEDSACRRGGVAPFGPRAQESWDGASLGAKVGVGLGEREGAEPGAGAGAGDLLLPSEILCAIREANGICVSESGSDSNSISNSCGGKVESVGEGRVVARRLWGMDETGQQGVQEVVHFCGEERGCDGRTGDLEAQGGSTSKTRGMVLKSATVLDGFSSRVHALESAVETCLRLMLVEGTVVVDA